MRASASGVLAGLVFLAAAAAAGVGTAHPGVEEADGVQVPAGLTTAPGALTTALGGSPSGGQSGALRAADFTAALAESLPRGLYFGATWVDLDDDGNLDLTLPFDRGEGGFLRVWRNEGTEFADITADLGLDSIPFARSAAWLDLDDDGDLDLFLTRRGLRGTNLAFEQQDGRMVPAPAGSGLEEPATDVGQAWADFDRDGDLDLYLPATILAPQRLFLREGPFRFRDASAETQLDPDVAAVSGTWADFDNDGDVDLTVGHITGIRFYRNEEGRVFEDVSGDAAGVPGFLVVPSWADADADGDLDLFAGGFGPARLFENLLDDENPRLEDRTLEWGGGYPTSRGGNWADLDLDGDLDLLDDGGDLGMHLHENSIPAGGRLVDVSAAAGLPVTRGIGWQPVTGDFDADGLADFFAPHQAAYLYRNATAPAGRWTTLRLVSRRGGVAPGARVRFEGGPLLQVREVAWPQTGFGFGSSDVILALGRRGAAASVDVRWPSGEVERFHGLSAGRLHRIVEGTGQLVASAARGPEGARRSFRVVAAGSSVPGASPAEASPAAESSSAPETSAESGVEPSLGIELSCNPCRQAVRFTIPGAPGEERRIRLYDLRGRTVRELAASSAVVTWDLRDDSGRRVPAAVYWAQSVGLARVAGVRVVVLR